ncbi:MAG: hypothetical protein HYY26_04530 [Acidobacteria bacterium]|nr:hypothetical protein [Acidobacteriota bacterium]
MAPAGGYAWPTPRKPVLSPSLFEEWVKAGPIAQIPWAVTIDKPYLRNDQRLAVDFAVRVPANYFNSNPQKHELLWLVRVQDESGAWLNDDDPFDTTVESPLPDDAELELQTTALMAPGSYRAAVLLYDRGSQARSLSIHEVRVAAPRGDALPGSFRTLPRAEFLASSDGLDALYQPKLLGRLWLPVETRRAVAVEILVNFSPSQQFTGQLAATYRNIARMIGALKALSEI